MIRLQCQSAQIIACLIITIFCVLFMSSCKDSKRVTETKEVEYKKIETDIEDFYREDAVLLSAKYKIEEDKIVNLLEEAAGGIKIESGNISFTSINMKRLVTYSEKYGLSPDIIASLLIDYQAMQKCGQAYP